MANEDWTVLSFDIKSTFTANSTGWSFSSTKYRKCYLDTTHAHRNNTKHKQHWPRGSGCGRTRVSCWLSVSVYGCLSADQKAALPVLLMILFLLSLPQGGLCVLAMQSVFEESLPRPSVDAIRGEMMPSCWVLQPVRHSGREVTRVIYLLQVRCVVFTSNTF